MIMNKKVEKRWPRKSQEYNVEWKKQVTEKIHRTWHYLNKVQNIQNNILSRDIYVRVCVYVNYICACVCVCVNYNLKK